MAGLQHWFLSIFMFLLGLVVGSFLGAVSYRVPRGMSIVSPGSSCPACGTRLTPADLIPVLSHLLSRGRCRHCRAPVPWRYTFIELLTGLSFAGAYALATGWFRAAPDWPLLAQGAVFASLMLVMAVIDLEHMLLPNSVNLIGLAAGLVFALAGAGPVTIWPAVYGAALGYGLIFVIVLVSRGGMGMGDAKFLAMIGAFVGPLGVLYTLFGASALGAATGFILIRTGRHEAKKPIPFGPFLAAAAVGVWAWLAGSF